LVLDYLADQCHLYFRLGLGYLADPDCLVDLDYLAVLDCLADPDCLVDLDYLDSLEGLGCPVGLDCLAGLVGLVVLVELGQMMQFVHKKQILQNYWSQTMIL
jgi:hypothetical protein